MSREGSTRSGIRAGRSRHSSGGEGSGACRQSREQLPASTRTCRGRGGRRSGPPPQPAPQRLRCPGSAAAHAGRPPAPTPQPPPVLLHRHPGAAATRSPAQPPRSFAHLSQGTPSSTPDGVLLTALSCGGRRIAVRSGLSRSRARAAHARPAGVRGPRPRSAQDVARRSRLSLARGPRGRSCRIPVSPSASRPPRPRRRAETVRRLAHRRCPGRTRRRLSPDDRPRPAEGRVGRWSRRWSWWVWSVRAAIILLLREPGIPSKRLLGHQGGFCQGRFLSSRPRFRLPMTRTEAMDRASKSACRVSRDEVKRPVRVCAGPVGPSVLWLAEKRLMVGMCRSRSFTGQGESITWAY